MSLLIRKSALIFFSLAISLPIRPMYGIDSITSSAAGTGLKEFDYTSARTLITQVENQVQSASPDKILEWEKMFIGVMLDQTAKPAGRIEAARFDALVASSASAKALGPLLLDHTLAQGVQGIFQNLIAQNAGTLHNQAVEALLTALSQASTPELKAGLANALGLSRDPQAVPALRDLLIGHLKDANPLLKDAAISALGLNGTTESARVLLKMSPDLGPDPSVTDALTVCSERLRTTDPATAMALAGALEKTSSGTAQAAAWLVQQRLAGKTDPDSLTKALQSSDRALNQSALFWIAHQGSDSVSVAITIFPKLTPDQQAEVISALSESRDPAAASIILTNLEATHPSLQMAAITAAGHLPLPSAIPILFKLASGEGEVGKAATAALGQIPSSDFDQQLLTLLDGKDLTGTDLALSILATRGSAAAMNHLTNPVLYTKPKSLAAANLLIKNYAGIADFEKLVPFALTLPEGPQNRLLTSLAAVVARLSEKDQALTILQNTASTPALKVSLYDIIASLGSPPALAYLAKDLQAPDTETRKSAIRALGKIGRVPEAQALLSVAAGDSDSTVRILALRAVCDIVSRPKALPTPQAVAILKQAENTATRPEDKKVTVASLALFKGPDALALAKEWTQQPEIADDAKAVLSKIERK